MSLKLVLDQYEFSRYDYGRAIGFKIYDEDENPFNCNSYTPSVAKIFKRHGERAEVFRDVARLVMVRGELAQVVNDITVAWTDQANGEGTITLTKTDRFTVQGLHWMEVELRDNADPDSRTVQISTELVRVYVDPSEGN